MHHTTQRTKEMRNSTRTRFCYTVLAVAIASYLPVDMAFAQATASEAAVQFDIPAGDLAAALERFSTQSGIQLLYRNDLVVGKRSKGVSGRYDTDEALRLVLGETGLAWDRTNATTFVLRKLTSSVPSKEGAASTPKVSTPKVKPVSQEESVTQLQKLTVTGTRIKGAELTSPLVMITQEDMRISGHANLGEVLRVLPQNFSGGQNPGVTGVGGGISNVNATGGSSFNLRGLGSDATLTLLNGSRLAYDGFNQAVDIDAIPVAAVERIDVLLDGASSIYGSDAVGGVVNVMLKRDYSGAEVSARLGTATSGGYTQRQYVGVAGTTWDSGGLIVTGSISRNTAVSAGQRDYLANMDPNHDIFPKISQKNLVLSGHQKFNESTELAVDAFFSDREVRQNPYYQTLWLAERRAATSWGINPSISFSLRDDMLLKFYAAFGLSESRAEMDYFSRLSEEKVGYFGEYYDNKNTAVGLELGGDLAHLPAGPIGYSLGVGYREAVFDMDYSEGGSQIDSKSNRSKHAYGEIDVPLIAEEQSIPFVRRLSVNGAVRHEKHDSFGESTTPKIGVFWGVNTSLDIKASWGKSFKAPTLLQQYMPNFISYDPSEWYTGAPESRTVMAPIGGNPDLVPEEATVVTAGLVFKPSFLAGTRVELNWFDIDYSKRVESPHRNSESALIDPASEAYRIINPTLGEIINEFEKLGLAPGEFGSINVDRPWNPDDVYAIVDKRYMNIARNKVQGVDLSARYAVDFSGGILTLAGNGSWITKATWRINPLAPEFPKAGVIFTPAKFKGRASAAWSRDTFTVSTAVNYIGGVLNDLVVPAAKGESMVTVDLVLDYWVESERFGEFGMNFGVANIFNRRAPYAAVRGLYGVPYDSTNHSALGRVLNLTLTKRF